MMSDDIARVAPLAFVASQKDGDDAAPLVEEEEGVAVLKDTFVAASKTRNGFVLRRGDKATSACVAPCAQACLAW